MKIEKFEDIKAWQEARRLVHLVYSFAKKTEFSKDFGLKGQIRRASVSVMANVAEGYGRKSCKEFRNFLNMSMASCVEVKSHLYVALDEKYITQDEFDRGYSACDLTSRLIYGFMKYLESLR